ncbi:MAG TPA: HD domain-containing phosphohydrolase [Rhodoferax sp.]|jgi:putative two-component system response regulator|nr:HD domain-containing phosphohydrolase [Rhodoferax sp.]
MDSAPVPLGDDSAQAAQALRVAFFAMATLAELRESDTESHLLRVQRYVCVLADKLKSHPAFAPTLTPGYIDLLCASVPMYDMGTVGIPDRILLKPGRLAPEELAIMRTHTTLGFDALVRAEKTLGQTSPLLVIAKEITLSHQEKWDGNGYPQGLAGTKIPLSARILAVADVYDALISNKVYKQGVEHEAAVQVIFSERASHFDPDVVDAFIEVSPEFAAIAQKYADTDADMQKKIEYLANAIAENAEM